VVIAAVMAPVVLDPGRRRVLRSVEPRYRLAVTAMVGCSFAGHLWLGSRTFPFVDWSMYTSPASGDPVVIEYDAVLRGGGTVALSPSRFLGEHSAGRLMERLRRQVLGILALPDGPRRAAAMHEHEQVLRAIAARLADRDGAGPIERVVVSESTVSGASGAKRRDRVLWEVIVA
jgi:hypothetical protein